MTIIDKPAAVFLSIDTLTPWDRNPRIRSEGSTVKLASIMCRLGFGAPLITRMDDNRIAVGHGRRLAFYYLLDMVERYGLPNDENQRLWQDSINGIRDINVPPNWYMEMKPEMILQLTERAVPVRRMPLDEDEANKLAIADNRMTEESEWNNDILGELFREMSGDELRFTGFDVNEFEPFMAEMWDNVDPTDPPSEGGSDGSETSAAGDESDGGSSYSGKLKLDAIQQGTFYEALEIARARWQRPEMPPAEFVVELSRRFLEDEKPQQPDNDF